MFYQWRKSMGVSYQEMLETPIKVVMRDISYLEVDAKVKKHLEKPNA